MGDITHIRYFDNSPTETTLKFIVECCKVLAQDTISETAFKGLVHLKIKILSLITHPHIVPNL